MIPYCLILDKRYYPCMILNFKKAFVLSLRETSKVLAYHPSKFLHSPHQIFQIPIVIQVNEVIDQKMIYVNPSRTLIFIRDNWTCQYCGREVNEKTATIDHVIPKSRGGLWSWTNLVTACEECNQKKKDQIWTPITKPVRPEPIVVILRKIINKLDNETLSIWMDFMPIKLKRNVQKLRGETCMKV